jgi:hypothetical protein
MRTAADVPRPVMGCAIGPIAAAMNAPSCRSDSPASNDPLDNEPLAVMVEFSDAASAALKAAVSPTRQRPIVTFIAWRASQQARPSSERIGTSALVGFVIAGECGYCPARSSELLISGQLPHSLAKSERSSNTQAPIPKESPIPKRQYPSPNYQSPLGGWG